MDRSKPLQDQVALVTGAQQGIGEAIAVLYAQAGADVAINWLDDRAAAERVAARVQSAGRRAILLQADLSDVEQARGLAPQTVAALGRLDVVVNNAGVYPRVPMLDMTRSDWDLVLNVNLRGTFFCSQSAAQCMIAAGTKGSILTLSSRSLNGAVRGVHYSASKGGLVSLTRSMALELAPHGIRVNAIAPGLTDTAQPRYGMTEQQITDMAAASPLGRLMLPADVAESALFLATSASACITGQVLHVNTGTHFGS